MNKRWLWVPMLLLLSSCGYNRIQELDELAKRARERLTDNKINQRYCRFIVQHFYSPVGSGVKTEAEAREMMARMFPGDRMMEVMSYIERRMAQLPGMAGLDACTRWVEKIQPLLPVELRSGTAKARRPTQDTNAAA